MASHVPENYHVSMRKTYWFLLAGWPVGLASLSQEGWMPPAQESAAKSYLGAVHSRLNRMAT
jgi:hypothetical protein